LIGLVFGSRSPLWFENNAYELSMFDTNRSSPLECASLLFIELQTLTWNRTDPDSSRKEGEAISCGRVATLCKRRAPAGGCILPQEIPVIHESPDSGPSESLLRSGGRRTAVPEMARKEPRGSATATGRKRYPLNSAYPIFPRNFTKTLNPPRGGAPDGAPLAKPLSFFQRSR